MKKMGLQPRFGGSRRLLGSLDVSQACPPSKGVSGSDSDPAETGEWIEALSEILATSGPARGGDLIRTLVSHLRSRGINIAPLLNSPYTNTINVEDQPAYPGDLGIERRITAFVRWNAMAMVVRANAPNSGIGGHLASYASAAESFEVGFHHFFHGDSNDSDMQSVADLVFFQPHSAPGIYARAYLEGRLTEHQLAHYRQETAGSGLCSYPHPRLMPTFWQFPTGSMGLGAITAAYQARFLRYLQHRNLLPPQQRTVWAFLGDGEMDEPESLAGLTLAAREQLDNLIYVINCNLQRLDGPVRGNGSIVRELERLFIGAGWNVIKVLWASNWDELFSRDHGNVILKRLDETLDGDLQTYGARDGAYNREHFFNRYDELARLTADLTDDQIDGLSRGGHDPVKIYAAFRAAVQHRGQPTVILAQTKKGCGLGRWAESRMSAHQQKRLDQEALLWIRDHYDIPLPDEAAMNAQFYRPAPDSVESRYLLDRRMALGGFLPRRAAGTSTTVPLSLDFAARPDPRETSTTTAFVRFLSTLLKLPDLSRRVVPIVADEARTFGMQSLFRQFGIYSPHGQLYTPQDGSDLLFYKESCDGQILEEGITEAGAMSSWIAAGTSYVTHKVPILPFYIFYSMFGFQRVGDLIWLAADARARGFLIGATSGRTTLAGEGLQHQDATSHLIASTISACRAYDPCFAYELSTILEAGIHSILSAQRDEFYYVTTMNENYVHPAMPPNTKEGIIRGMYLLREARSSGKARVQLLGSGAILREAVAAADLLDNDWNISADVWSVTSFTELRRNGLEIERGRLLHSGESELPWITQCLNSTEGPIIAASDYVRAVPDLIRAWVPRTYVVLGTDGYGRSDTRADLRRFFEVDRLSIAFAALSTLVRNGAADRSSLISFAEQYGYKPSTIAPWNL
jgi:pyruvate dehydrogenase E1 component